MRDHARRIARQRGLHGEEVGAEEGREEDLLHGDFGGDTERLRGGVVEARAQEEEPFVARDAGEAADEEHAECAGG